MAAIAAIVWFGMSRTSAPPLNPKEVAVTTERSGSAPPTKGCVATFVSWNIANFGRKKTDDEIALMAKVLARADIVAVQEVVAGKDFGAQAVARLAVALGRTGAAWDYIVSDPTQPPSEGVERYAFLWKKHVATINRDEARLVSALEQDIDREPYTLTFHVKGAAPVPIYTIHAVPSEKHPITEVRALASSPEITNASRAVVAGDFNLPPQSTDPLFAKAGYQGHIAELTTLKGKVSDGGYRARQYDNIYTKGLTVCSAGVIDFVDGHFTPLTPTTLRAARHLSDHLPVFITFR